MRLPGYVMTCVDALEQAGFAAYAVGGCVRDALLGLTPHDYDLCTCATPAEIRRVFSAYRLVLAGEKHGTVQVIVDGNPVEITTFRTEGGYADSRHPDWVHFETEVEADLSRRDFTVNAMAYSPYRSFADPFGGKADLENHCLRAVGNPTVRFQEDALRILRGVRFCVSYGLQPEAQTLQAMTALASDMDKLARERIFEELCKLLPRMTAQDLLRFTPILIHALPELTPMVGFQQHSPYHAYDLLTHTAYVVETVPPVLALRFAALLHDIGKPDCFYLDETGRGHFPGHAQRSAALAETILLRLKAPTSLRQQVVDLISRHMTPLEPDKRLLRRRLAKYGIPGVLDLLALQRADFHSKGIPITDDPFNQIEALLEEIQQEAACLTLKQMAINGSDLLRLGMSPGPAVGACLNQLFREVLDGVLSNEREALLARAQTLLSQN